MNTTLLDDAAVSRQPFKVLVLYDTAASGASGVSAYRRFSRTLEESYSFSLKVWRLDQLDLPARSKWVTQDVAAADMVIVAWKSPVTALSSRRAWAERWPTVPAEPRRALVSLFTGPEDDQHCPAVESEFLRRLAKRTGMDLICSTPSLAEGALCDASAACVEEARQSLAGWSYAGGV